MLVFICRLLVIVSTVSMAQAASVKEIFDKYNLLGTFAWDCTKPANGSNNWYHVHRLLDPGHVQRDFMSDATTRQWFAIVDTAAESGPNEIALSGTITGRVSGRDLDNKPTAGIWHVESGRIQQREATVDGQKVVADGKLTANGFQIPVSNRCGS